MHTNVFLIVSNGTYLNNVNTFMHMCVYIQSSVYVHCYFAKQT